MPVNRTGLLACLASLAMLASCARSPVAPATQARSRPIGPICAVPPKGAAPALPVAREAGPRPEVLLARARQLRSEGDHAGALGRLEQAAVQAPDDADVCFELADLLVADEADLDRAGAMLLAIPASHPGRDAALGRLAELRGDAETAQSAYARHLTVVDAPEIRLRRAVALERLGRDAEAIAELERLRAADPANAMVRARLAERYEAVGRLDEAEAELRALADAIPGRPEGWRRLAAFCGRHGRTEQPSCALARARTREVEAPSPRDLRPLRPTGR